MRAVAGDRHGVPVRAPRHERIERIRRPRRDELVARLEQRGRRRGEQLGGAVADHDLVGVDAVALRQLGAQRARVRVDVAVQPAARGERDRVDDEVVRQPGPGRPREVERVDPLELARAALVGLLAQLLADLLGRQALELPVVVEQPHSTDRDGAIDGPGPR